MISGEKILTISGGGKLIHVTDCEILKESKILVFTFYLHVEVVCF